MQPEWAKESDDGEGGGDGDDDTGAFAAAHVVALVDCHPDMFAKSSSTPPSPSPFDSSLFIMEILMQHTIEDTVVRKMGKRNGVGILLYNTKPIKPGSKEKNDEKSGTNGRGDNNKQKEAEDDDEDEMDDDDEDKMDDDDDDEDDDEGEVPDRLVHELVALAPPGITNVQTVRYFQHRKEDRDLETEFRPTAEQAKAQEESSSTALQLAIETAQRMFLSASCVKDPKTASSKARIGEMPEKDLRSIWIFTNRATPYTNTEATRLIGNVANEAIEAGIEIVVWPLSTGGSQSADNGPAPFYSPFFESLLGQELKFKARFPNQIAMEDELLEMERENRKNKKSYTTPMYILEAPKKKEAGNGDGSSGDKSPIVVDWYSFAQVCRRPGKVKIDSETKLKVKRQRILALKETDSEIARFYEPLTVEERERREAIPALKLLRKFFNFVNEPVAMPPDDTNEMKTFGCRLNSAGLLILGFKPRNSIPTYHAVKPPSMIYPSDVNVRGSKAAFARLHAAMLRKNVLAVGQLRLRENWEWRYCALYPLPSNPQGGPNGMMVVQLPFREDLRGVEPDAATREANLQKSKDISTASNHESFRYNGDGVANIKEELGLVNVEASNENEDDGSTGNIASEELVVATMNLMARMDLDEHGVVLNDELLDNPAMLDFFDYLSSVAFSQPRTKGGKYLARPDEEDKKKTMENARAEIDDYLSKLPVDAEKPLSSRKRVKQLTPDQSGLDWESLLQSGDISKCKVDQLKSYLRSVGETLSGRKDELVTRVTVNLQRQLPTAKKVKQEDSMEV